MPEEKPPSKFIYYLTQRLFAFLFKILYRLSISGRENIPQSGATMLVANHTSFLDPPILAITTKRPVYFMAKEELFKIPVLGTFMNLFSAIPVNREKVSPRVFRTTLKLLAKGEVLGMFPEGRRQRLGYKKLGPLLTGAGYLALKSGSPIIPVGISGTDKVMPKGKHVPRFPKIMVMIGKPIEIDNRSIGEENIARLTKKVEQAIIDLLV